ncbi:MAG: hypothetical protein AAB434_04665 [Planctomycetota bacterium]
MPLRRLLLRSIVFAILLPAGADEVYLKNGSVIEGDVAERGERVEVTTGGGVLTLERSQVERIVRKESRADDYARRAAEVREGDVEGHRELARWCEEQGLYVERRKEYEAILGASPDDAQAREALGFVKVMGRWIEVSERWTEEETDHFSIRTDTGIGEELGRYLELGTQAFQAAYGGSFASRPLEGSFSALVFRDRAELVAKLQECYPDSPQAKAGFAEVVAGFTLPVDRITLVYFPEESPTDGLETLLHEMAHLLFYELAVPDDVTRGLTPQEIQERLVEGRGLKWFHEGLACYVGGSTVTGTTVHLGEFAEGGVSSRMAKQAAKAIEEEREIPLERLVEGGIEEFTGPDCLLYYAEAWTFLHFLHHGLDGRMAGAVGRMGELVASGEGGREAIERALKVPIGDLAPAWRMHVKELATR